VAVKKTFYCLLLCIVCGWLGVTAVACSAPPPDFLRLLLPSPAAPFVAEGDRQSAEGRAAEAILAYRQAVARDDRHAPALRKLGQAYAAQGRTRLAQQYLHKAAALRPDDTEIKAELQALQTTATPDGPLEQAWMALSNTGIPAGMAVGDGAVAVAFGDGQVVLLDAATGKQLWASKLPAGAASAPGLGAGLALVGGEDGALHALARADGRALWRYQTDAPIYAAPLATDDAIYAPSGDGSFAALAPADGALRWKIAAVAPLTGRPALAGGLIYFGAADGRIFGMEAATGREVWGSGIVAQGAVESQPTIAGGRVFVGAGDSRLYTLAADTGGEYWRYSTPDAIYARPIVFSDTVYLASAGHTLSALDLLSGELKWELTAGSALRHTPALIGGTLYYIAAADPNLYAVDAPTGAPLWQLDTGDWLADGPVIADGRLYLLGQDGAVMAFRVSPQ
jgi:outer membrane protein assembly factor BamB